MDAETFQREAGSFAVDWTIKFAEAPIDVVSDLYGKFRNCPIARNVAVDSSDAGQLPPQGVIIQPADTNWVILFHEWSRFPKFPILSGVNARTVEFGGSDGNHPQICNLFTPSKPIVRYKTPSVLEDENEYYEASGTRQSARPKFTTVDRFATVFDDLQIKLVFVCLNEDRRIFVRDEDRMEIVRADIAVVPHPTN